MTREEALQILDTIPTIGEQVDALEMAIQALQEPSGDAISREDTLTAFADYVGSGMSMNDYDALWNIVAKIPSVKQEQTGHWDSRTCKCSECGYQIAFSEYAERKYKYCPNCGSAMVEQESEE